MDRPPRRVVVLRHGQTAFNAQGRVQGQLDVPLDDEGVAQAAAAAKLLAGVPSAVVSSDLVRAHRTAEVVAAASGLAVTADPRLRELDLGAWQGLTVSEISHRWPAEYAAWRRGEDVVRGGGESYAAAADRAEAAVQAGLADLPAGATLLAVTHGGTGRGLLGRLLGLPQPSWWALAPLGNALWSVLLEAESGWRLERHNAGPSPAAGALPGARDLGALPVDVDREPAGSDSL